MALQKQVAEQVPHKTASRRKKPAAAQNQAEAENVVVFTSFDGTVHEVGELPLDLGRATALANEKAVRKIWGMSDWDDMSAKALCHNA